MALPRWTFAQAMASFGAAGALAVGYLNFQSFAGRAGHSCQATLVAFFTASRLP